MAGITLGWLHSWPVSHVSNDMNMDMTQLMAMAQAMQTKAVIFECVFLALTLAWMTAIAYLLFLIWKELRKSNFAELRPRPVLGRQPSQSTPPVRDQAPQKHVGALVDDSRFQPPTGHKLA